MVARRAALAPDAPARAAAEMMPHLRPLLRAGMCVGVFAAMRGEPAIDEALVTEPLDIRIAWPVVVRTDRSLVFRVPDAPPTARSSFGIREPQDGSVLDPTAIDLVLVPALAFDGNGHRLGFGAGYYDRFLKTIRPDALRIGIGYEWQCVDALPVEPHDVPMHLLLTPTGLRRVAATPTLV